MKRLKIALNALSAQAGGGISGFVNLIPALAKIDKKNRYIIFVSSRQREILEAIPSSFKKVAIDYIPSNPYARGLWEQLVFPFYLLFYRIDVLYSVGNITTLLAPCKVVLLIENSNPYSMANIKWPWKERLRNKFLKCLGWLSAKKANKIRFVSDNSKNLLVKHLNLPLKKYVTIYHGCNYDYCNIENCDANEFALKYNYILTVGVVAPHKNLHLLIKAFDILVKTYNYTGNLVIVGDLCYPDYTKKLRILISELKLNERVIFTGKVEHKNIRHYYRHADVFVLPSIEETFGIPVIEAMGNYVPVAVSDGLLSENYFIPFREICSNAAYYFNPFDFNDIAEGIYKIISDKKYREQLKQNGINQVKKYKWTETARSLVDVFNEVGLK